MTAHQQEITVLIAGLALSVAVLGLLIMLSALAFPAISTAGRRLFATGASVAVCASLVFLSMAITASFMLSEVTP